MSDVVVQFRRDGEDAFDAMYRVRQRRLARERCRRGHDFRPNRSLHLGFWVACSGCGLIESEDGTYPRADRK